MALEQFHTKTRFDRINMPDDRRMMHAQHFRRAAHRAKPRNLIRSAHFVPILHLIPVAKISVSICADAPDFVQYHKLCSGVQISILSLRRIFLLKDQDDGSHRTHVDSSARQSAPPLAC